MRFGIYPKRALLPVRTWHWSKVQRGDGCTALWPMLHEKYCRYYLRVHWYGQYDGVTSAGTGSENSDFTAKRPWTLKYSLAVRHSVNLSVFLCFLCIKAYVSNFIWHVFLVLWPVKTRVRISVKQFVKLTHLMNFTDHSDTNMLLDFINQLVFVLLCGETNWKRLSSNQIYHQCQLPVGENTVSHSATTHWWKQRISYLDGSRTCNLFVCSPSCYHLWYGNCCRYKCQFPSHYSLSLFVHFNVINDIVPSSL